MRASALQRASRTWVFVCLCAEEASTGTVVRGTHESVCGVCPCRVGGWEHGSSALGSLNGASVAGVA